MNRGNEKVKRRGCIGEIVWENWEVNILIIRESK